MADGGEREAALTADYNAEMVEHVARYPSLRDRSVFVGDPADVVDVPLGPGLPGAREWTEQHFAFSGYVMGERPAAVDRPALRRRLGYADGDVVCVVSVGGSGVGAHLLRRVLAAYPEAPRPGPGPADGRGGRAADRPRLAALRRTASRCTGSSPTWTCTTRPATSRSCRAG